jgi:hypothetical protein
MGSGFLQWIFVGRSVVVNSSWLVGLNTNQTSANSRLSSVAFYARTRLYLDGKLLLGPNRSTERPSQFNNKSTGILASIYFDVKQVVSRGLS